MTSSELRSEPPINSRPVLNWGGRLLLGLLFAVGVALSIYAGLMIGGIIGLGRGVDTANNTPTQNLGMAPDLSGLVNGTIEFVTYVLVGGGLGLILGVALMWATCRYAFGPLLRYIPALRRARTGAVTG